MSTSSFLNVLVVGGAGYIGSHVTKALLSVGHCPTIFDNMSSGLRQNLFDGVPFIHGDLLLADQIRQATKGMDVIIHLAALKAAGESMLKPEKYAHHNLIGAINLLNAASEAGVKKFIFSSTAAVYGDPQYTPMDEKHPTNPMNFYGHNKLQIEELLKWYDQLKGLKYVSLRYFNAAGYDIDQKINGLEQSPQNLFPIVMEAVMGQRDSVAIYGDDYDTPDGSCIRDYIHVTDLADAHVKALQYLQDTGNSDIFNLGTATGTSVLEALEATKKISGVDFKTNIVPRRDGDPPIVLANPEKAHCTLNWKAQYSDPGTIVKTMLHAYRTNN